MRAGQRACLLAHARRLPLKVLAPLPREVRVVIAHEHVAGASGGGGRRQRARWRRRGVSVAPLLLLLEPLPHVKQRGVGRERVPQRPVLGAQGERARVARGGGGRLDCVRHGVRRAGLPGRRLSHRERGGVARGAHARSHSERDEGEQHAPAAVAACACCATDLWLVKRSARSFLSSSSWALTRARSSMCSRFPRLSFSISWVRAGGGGLGDGVGGGSRGFGRMTDVGGWGQASGACFRRFASSMLG